MKGPNTTELGGNVCTDYDVIIIGGGLAGLTLATILASNNTSVLVLEAKEHPRFAVGESMILETSEMMRAAAHYFDVAEVAHLSSENYRKEVGTTHGVKKHFGFCYHKSGDEHDAENTLQAVIPKDPYGHELHIYRQDSDHAMMVNAINRGAVVKQNVDVSDIEINEHQARVFDRNGLAYSSRFVVDGGGYRSVIADKYNLRTNTSAHRSRALFTHMIGVDGYNPGRLPYPMKEGTLHHVFDGGWLWIIPFDNFKGTTNHVQSVGLVLDPDKHPEDQSVTPEVEFGRLIQQFPTVERQLRSARPIRDWVRTGTLQYGSRQVVGDRWALLGHAAGFVDPLYSKGLYLSMASVVVLAHSLLDMFARSDFDRSNLLPLERMVLRYLRRNDRLINTSFLSWSSPELWRTYSVLWLLGAYTELLKLGMLRVDAGDDRNAYVAELSKLELVGGGFGEFFQLSDTVDQKIESSVGANKRQLLEINEEVLASMNEVEWMPDPFRKILSGAPSLPRRKVRPELFTGRSGGPLGTGNYRQHFFGSRSLWNVGLVAIQQKLTYSTFSLPAHRKLR